MREEVQMAKKNISKKQIKINSIKEPNIKRILRPCEARAGHGFIAMIIGLGVIGAAMAILVPLLVKLYKWWAG